MKPRGCFEWFRGTVLKIREPPSRDLVKVRSRAGPSSCDKQAYLTDEVAAQKRGTLYLVIFRRHHTNMRDIFSSLEGNIRPDTPPVRALVRRAS